MAEKNDGDNHSWDKDGERAFPAHDADFYWGGMSLRDYFAAQAMNGLLAGDHPITHDMDAPRRLTSAAYATADAMLAERAK